jgi:pimeloyl-ACP methyl ester carboxylesterase
VAMYVWYVPIRQKLYPRHKKIIGQAEAKILHFNGKNVFTYKWGEGKKILLVHGWSGHTGQLTKIINALLEHNYQIISFDAPAHGSSSGKQTDYLEISKIISQITKTFTNNEGFEAIIAHSFGVNFVCNALNNGVKTKKFIALAPMANVDRVYLNFKISLNLSEKVMKKLRKLQEKKFKECKPLIWENISTIWNAKKINVSTLIIHDKDDEEIPITEGLALKDALKNSSILITENLGHYFILENMSVISKMIEFIKKE